MTGRNFPTEIRRSIFWPGLIIKCRSNFSDRSVWHNGKRPMKASVLFLVYAIFGANFSNFAAILFLLLQENERIFVMDRVIRFFNVGHCFFFSCWLLKEPFVL